MQRVRRMGAGAAIIALFSSAASADPVRIVTSGSIDAHEGDSTFELLGDGFLFVGEIPNIGDALGDCVFGLCEPGDVVDLSAHGTPHVSGVDITTAMFDGREYEGVFLTGNLFLDSGSVVAPDLPVDGFVTLTAPFTFRGDISAFDNVGLSGSALFATDLRGAGTVSLQFTNNPEVGLQASRVTYRFEETAPIPEPATMLLLGSGLAGLVLRRRRQA